MNFEKNLIRIFIGVSFLCAVLSLALLDANAQPSLMTNKIFLNPFYKLSMSSNTNYSYTFTINPPDKISFVSTAIITIDVWMTPTVNYDLWIDSNQCSNPRYTISTTYSGAGNAKITFDCSNIIKSAGTYTATLRADKNSGASTAWIDVTYSNNPAGDLMLHGTEYFPGEPAKIWLQLINSQLDYVSDALCFIHVYTPSNAVYIENAQMTNLGENGVYYYDLVAPETLGIYPIVAECIYGAIEKRYYPQSIQVSRGTPVFVNLDSAFNIDANYFQYNENAPSPRRVDLNWSFTAANISSCANTLMTEMLGLNIFIYGYMDSVANDNINVSIFNWTSNTWIDLINPLVEGGIYTTSSNTINVSNITTAGYYSPANGIRLRTTDTNLTDGTNSNFFIDQIFIGCNRINTNWYRLPGSGELDISSPNITMNVSTLIPTQIDMTNYTQVSEYVWAYFNRTLTNFTYQSCNVSFNITNNLNVSVNGTDLGNVSGQINYLTGEWSMAIELIAIIALFVAALLILIFVKNTGILFISTLMFFADFVMLKGIDGMDMVAYIMLILMFFPIFKIIGIRKKGRESAYVGNY